MRACCVIRAVCVLLCILLCVLYSIEGVVEMCDELLTVSWSGLYHKVGGKPALTRRCSERKDAMSLGRRVH